MRCKIIIIGSILLLNAIKAFAQENAPAYYENPIVAQDYSDPDVCGADGDFFMTASSFCCMPGLPILHSSDLMHWRIVNYALREEYAGSDGSSAPRHGKGVWAPSIRCHDGIYYIFWGDPDYGIYMIKADDPTKEWSKPLLVIKGKGMIDPCPLWDEDGKAYLVHAWAGSRAKMNSALTMWSMETDGSGVIGDPVLVFDGYDGTNHTVEGPKLYKKEGKYYIMAPAGGVEKGWQLALRSDNIFGPYECKTVMSQGESRVNGPHQGGLVDTKGGATWFLHFQDKGVFGRVLHLNPVEWKDGWPVVGIDSDGDGCGTPVETYKLPDVGTKKSKYGDKAEKKGVSVDDMSDEFDSPSLGLQWQWMSAYQPSYGFTTNMGYMRLYNHILQTATSSCWEVPNLMLQKMQAKPTCATAKVTVSAREDGQSSGLIVMGLDYCRLALTKEKDAFVLEQVFCHDADKGGMETRVRICDIPYDKHFGESSYEVYQRTIYLRIRADENGLCKLSYSLDGETYTSTKFSFKARAGKWIGAKIGFFSVALSTCKTKGWMDIDWFRVSDSSDKMDEPSVANANNYEVSERIKSQIMPLSKVKRELADCDAKVKRTLRELHGTGDSIDYTLYPRNIMKGEKQWNLRKGTKDEWCSGFWPGILWYDYENTGDSSIMAEARNYTAPLEYLSKTPAFDHDLGFLIFCSYGNGYRLTGDKLYKNVIIDTADTLATLFRPKVGTILSWPRNTALFGGHNTIMDNMINLETLLWAAKKSGDIRLYDIAVSHADTTMRYHFRDDYSSYHVAVYDSIIGAFIRGCTHQGYSDTSMWARGQSWAIYGYTTVYRETGEQRFLDFAQKVTDIYLRRLTDDYVPYWDFDDPGIPNAPRDASTAAVVASALLDLSQYVEPEKSERYILAASRMLESLSSAKYKSGDENSSFLLHSVGHKPAGTEIDASIIYSDYYYIEALTKLRKMLE